MRKKRASESEDQRNDRLEKDVQRRIDNARAEESAMDAMVKQSIGLHGA
jgi:F0F1-type ATP synthase assembly protein I